MRSAGAAAVVALVLASLLGAAPASRAAAPPGPSTAPADQSPYMDSVGAALGGRQWTVNDYARSFANDEAMGVRWAYAWVSWSDIETSPGYYGWAGLDGLVTSAHQHGIQLMLQVQTAGDFVAPGPAQVAATGGTRLNSMHPMFPSAAPKRFAGPLSLWRALAARYRPGGDLARAMGWGDDGVRWFEIENEPDSFAWPTGNWSTVPKDYALYVSAVKATLRSVSPELRTVGPALSTGPDSAGCCNGVSWLAEVLRTSTDPAAMQWASDDYRAAVKGGQRVVSAGPFLDAISFHDDFYDPATTYALDRANAVRNAVAGAGVRPVLWETEGAPVETNSGLYARAQAQMTVRLLAAGVQRINLDTAGARTDDARALATDPIAAEVRALTSAFPSALGVRSRTAELSAAAGRPVEAYSWTDPATGRTSWIVWAPNQPRNSRQLGPPFAVRIPVHTTRARVIGADWTTSDVTVTGGSVDVQLQSADPSPVTFVVELPDH